MEEDMIWGEEGGRVLKLRRDGSRTVFEVADAIAPGQFKVIGAVTVARFRGQRVVAFLTAEAGDD